MTAAARGCVYPIAILVMLTSLALRGVSAYLFQMEIPVRHEFIEVLHHHCLRKHRQFMQGALHQTFMKALVEGRTLVSILAQIPQCFRLIRLQLWPAPTFMLAKLFQRMK